MPAAITVFAGDDTRICNNADLDLSTLQATISGDVSDGTWFSLGDGFFQSTGSNSATFSTANVYHPGSGDQTAGFFELILVSDDPDGNGPMVEVTDNVVIYFQAVPPLVCNTNLSVSLDVDCEQVLTLPMLVASPDGPLDKYQIVATDATGQTIANNTVTGQHLGQTISFRVSHECSPTNSCGGTLTVSDYVAPVITCTDTIVDCDQPSDALSLGLPVPVGATIDTISLDTFAITGWDACGMVLLTYSDSASLLNCGQPFTSIINRLWRVEDGSSNVNVCNQTVYSRGLPLDSIVFPPHYNDLHQPALSCDADFPRLENGHPHPSYTGSPALAGCSNIEVTMTDTRYDGCGGSYSIWRNWSVIDWCTARDIDRNQIIKVLDTLAPQIECPDSILVGTTGYDCWSRPFTVMSLDSVVDCSDWSVIARLQPAHPGVDIVSTDMTFDQVPVGEYTLLYEVTDACGNSTTCQTTVRVVDTSVPFAICEGFTKVSVSDNGFGRLYAASLDDSSFDNCGIAQLEIARMQGGCGSQAASFGSYIDFCCADIGSTQMVAFRVTDGSGNANTCMAEVTVEDKIAPEIICPSDITITCDFPIDTADLDRFGTIALAEHLRGDIVLDGQVYGRDGLASDNCSVSVYSTYTQSIDCGQGAIVRTFVATDNYGSQSTCTQTITVERVRDFTSNDINWPSKFISEGCGVSDHGPDVTGEPSYEPVPCARVEATFDDQVFEVSDSACVKILRTWTVVDWCLLDPVTGQGRWSHVQVIKIDNYEAPSIENCVDTTLCTFADNCGPAQYDYVLRIDDDCTALDDLYINWSIDTDADGGIDYSGSGPFVSAELSAGIHQVEVVASDLCGNRSTCDYQITVEDCKRPTPYCRSQLSTVVMPTNGRVTVRASDFDLGGTDNCSDILSVSFSEQVNDTLKVLTCDDLEGEISRAIDLEIWYTDESDNADYCMVEVLLQDNGNACGNGPNLARMAGQVTSTAGEVLDSMQINFSSADGTIAGQTWALQGNYEISVPIGKSYSITPVHEVEANAAVTTLDLVLTQRHIIRLAPFVDPMQEVAADLNDSESVSGADIVAMRQLALRTSNSLPVSTMVFVPASFDFDSATGVHGAPGSIQITDLQADRSGLDFYMVKRGDTNGDFFRTGRQAAPRSAQALGLEYRIDNDQAEVTFYAKSDGHYDGLQLHLEHLGAAVIDVRSHALAVGDYDLHRMLGETYLVLALTEPVVVSAGEPLFSVLLDQSSAITLGGDLLPELYEEGVPYSVELEPLNSEVNPDWQVTLANNPFDDEPIVQVYSSDDLTVNYTLTDVAGRFIASGEQSFSSGGGQLKLAAPLFVQSGTYYLKLTTGGQQEVVKLLKI